MTPQLQYPQQAEPRQAQLEQQFQTGGRSAAGAAGQQPTQSPISQPTQSPYGQPVGVYQQPGGTQLPVGQWEQQFGPGPASPAGGSGPQSAGQNPIQQQPGVPSPQGHGQVRQGGVQQPGVQQPRSGFQPQSGGQQLQSGQQPQGAMQGSQGAIQSTPQSVGQQTPISGQQAMGQQAPIPQQQTVGQQPPTSYQGGQSPMTQPISQPAGIGTTWTQQTFQR